LYNKRKVGTTIFGIGDVRPLIKGYLHFKARIPLIYQWGVRQIKLALLFGSRATDEFSPKSDYDIAVLTERDIDAPWGVSAKLWSDLPQALDLPEWDLDIIDLKDTSKAMLNSIEKSYILLKGDESELQRVFNGDRENCK
jgi:predicted nucleotidyltransferase